MGFFSKKFPKGPKQPSIEKLSCLVDFSISPLLPHYRLIPYFFKKYGKFNTPCVLKIFGILCIVRVLGLSLSTHHSLIGSTRVIRSIFQFYNFLSQTKFIKKYRFLIFFQYILYLGFKLKCFFSYCWI